MIYEQELECILNCCNVHENALIRLMYTSGMRVKDICGLNYYDFLSSIAEYFHNSTTSPFHIDQIYEQLRNRYDVFAMWELSHKGNPYTTYCTPETIHAILDSLYLRKGCREIDPKEPLFIGPYGSRINEEDIETIFEKLSAESWVEISPIDLRELFLDILCTAGVSFESMLLFLGYTIEPCPAYMIEEVKNLKFVYKMAAPEFNLVQIELKISLAEYQNLLDLIRIGSL